ncbi:MAG: hypothetical protein ABIP19_06170 [Dermatophilaceae bacterium]
MSYVAPPETPIVCLQNGLANEPALLLFPNVQAVSVACPASRLEPGVVQAWSAPGSWRTARSPELPDPIQE